MSTNLSKNLYIIVNMKRILGERLKELRMEQGLSYEKLSKLIGLDKSSLCNWENCKCDVASDNLVKLAKFYKVSTDYLVGLED